LDILFLNLLVIHQLLVDLNLYIHLIKIFSEQPNIYKFALVFIMR